MLTRIEIDGFKTFEGFSLDLEPLTAIVGPNASGKSNLFDALRFLSLLAQYDIRTAMQGLRGEPEELFRRTPVRIYDCMSFAVEVFLGRKGSDAFGTSYEIPAQRLRYELKLALTQNSGGVPKGIIVREEHCYPIDRKGERATYLRDPKLKVNYNARVAPFIRLNDGHDAILIRQDGRQKHGRPVRLSLKEASRTALSTIATAEFPHLYALRETLTRIRFLEINPRAARNANDRFEDRVLKPDASNLAAVLAHLKEETADNLRPDGVLSDIAADLATLIPSVRRLEIRNDSNQRQYSFSLEFSGDLAFSSRVISDGTLRLLALLTVLNDPGRQGTLCFEEPENGVHEGRVPMLVEFLRGAANVSIDPDVPSFQILLNTHSPKVMAALHDREIVAADSVIIVDPVNHVRSTKTRMRTGIQPTDDLFDPETNLSRSEVGRLLQKLTDAA
ncbi:MAG TPA: AAA family ATPase [Acetobacteraceae bacterium]|nr:AAA family ATPase [Acetobacteraceae bacterium]